MCSLCWLPVAQNHNFGQILTFGDSCTDPLLPMRAKCDVLQQTRCLRLRAKFRIDRFILSPSASKKKQFCHILPYFGIRHLVVSPIGSSLRNLTTGAQLQTFPYSTVSKSFLYSNAFMAKSGAQSLTFKSVTNKQTDRQKKQRFWPPTAAGEIRAPPNLAW